ncbi:MAG: hypothetical protein IJ801_01415, partial [Lachnospiraceae bacterium]|nr:hypothetical protein [Lachnospiraceae bacterium]
MNIIYFNICAIPIFIIILFTTFIRRATRGLSNKLFIAMVGTALVATVADLGLELLPYALPLSGTELVLGQIAAYIYFVFRHGMIVLYLLFLFSITRTSYRIHTTLAKVVILIPYGIVLLLLLQNLLTENVFFVSPEYGYERAGFMVILYGVSILYAVVGTVYLLFCIRFLNFGKWLALVSMYLLCFVAVVVEFFYPRLVIEMFAMAIALLLVILLVLRPEEITDSSMGLPSWKAYRTELKKLITTKQEAQIVVVRFINANEIRTYLGEERYQSYVIRIADQINQLCRNEHLSYEMYFEQPGSLYIILDNMD